MKKLQENPTYQFCEDFTNYETFPTVCLTPIGNLVFGYQEFLVAPSETIVGLVKKIRSPTWSMVRS